MDNKRIKRGRSPLAAARFKPKKLDAKKIDAITGKVIDERDEREIQEVLGNVSANLTTSVMSATTNRNLNRNFPGIRFGPGSTEVRRQGSREMRVSIVRRISAESVMTSDQVSRLLNRVDVVELFNDSTLVDAIIDRINRRFIGRQ